MNEISSGTVMVVGQVELVPPLQPGEQQLKLGTFDPLDMAGKLRDRAVLHLANEHKATEETWEVINPRLGETFFFRIPQDKRFVVMGTITTKRVTTKVTRRQVVEDVAEIILPRIEFDLKPTDKAVYVGTLRLHRDEFNEVTKAEILDHYSRAPTEFKKKFGGSALLRKAIAKPLK
ncbi:MAG: hypothetical protein ACREX4_09850 [Gammaproteobacteria bacterium]